ncbi:glucosamine-6-phosphate deaminase [Candidatus Bathyarchaeota archaeon]|nr:glucosamine-6-phosphate deaminase [Candidatus Bathyarchaeota archaeon]
MKVIIVKDYGELSQRASFMIADALKRKRPFVLGLATGGTPEGCYRELVRMHGAGCLDFSHVITFNLDEYVGIPPYHPNSYRYYMEEKLFRHINIDRKNIHFLNSMARDLEAECQAYEEAIKAVGGIDLQVLGIGRNGHIAFNEPGSPIDSRTRVVTLSDETRIANSRFFSSLDEVPKKALTMGIGTILEARRILLLASGPTKAEAIKAAVEGPITPNVPASFLRIHKDSTFIVDREAGCLLGSRDGNENF